MSCFSSETLCLTPWLTDYGFWISIKLTDYDFLKPETMWLLPCSVFKEITYSLVIRLCLRRQPRPTNTYISWIINNSVPFFIPVCPHLEHPQNNSLWKNVSLGDSWHISYFSIVFCKFKYSTLCNPWWEFSPGFMYLIQEFLEQI